MTYSLSASLSVTNVQTLSALASKVQTIAALWADSGKGGQGLLTILRGLEEGSSTSCPGQLVICVGVCK